MGKGVWDTSRETLRVGEGEFAGGGIGVCRSVEEGGGGAQAASRNTEIPIESHPKYVETGRLIDSPDYLPKSIWVG